MKNKITNRTLQLSLEESWCLLLPSWSPAACPGSSPEESASASGLEDKHGEVKGERSCPSVLQYSVTEWSFIITQLKLAVPQRSVNIYSHWLQVQLTDSANVSMLISELKLDQCRLIMIQSEDFKSHLKQHDRPQTTKHVNPLSKQTKIYLSASKTVVFMTLQWLPVYVADCSWLDSAADVS